MNAKNSVSLTFLSIALLIQATGCTHMVDIHVQPTTLQPGNTLPIRAGLVLNKELADYSYTLHYVGDSWLYDFGPPLQDYARRTANAIFQQVVEEPSVDAALANTDLDVVLVPRPVRAEQSNGLTIRDKAYLTLAVEWRAMERSSHNTVWLTTIKANAEEVQGNIVSAKRHRAVLFQKLFDDMSLKTQEAFQNAPELRNLAHH